MIWLLVFGLGVACGRFWPWKYPVAIVKASSEVEWRSDDVWVIPYDVKTATIMSGWEEIPRA